MNFLGENMYYFEGNQEISTFTKREIQYLKYENDFSNSVIF